MSFESTLIRVAEESLGGHVDALTPLPAGLSTRRFFRITLSGAPIASAIARVDSEDERGSGPEPPMEPLRRFLAEAGYPVPARHGGGPLEVGGDRATHVEFLQDLGDQSLERAARGAEPPALRELYREACSLPARLQRLSDPIGGLEAFARHFPDFLSLKEERFATLGLPTLLGRAPSEGEHAALREGFARIREMALEAPERLAHRDFQSSNLLLTPAGLVTIDFQGAFLAPPEYDLVCLLQDSYVELPEGWGASLALEARSALPDPPEPALFLRRFDLLTLARKAKDYAFFCDAAARGDRRFEDAKALTLHYLRAAAARASLGDACFSAWRDWFEAPPKRAKKRDES